MKKKLALSVIFIFSFFLWGGNVPFVYAQETLLFPDLPETDRYYEAIHFLYDLEVVEGYEDNTFRPYDEINRAETLKILLLAFDETENVNPVELNDATPDATFTEPPTPTLYFSDVQQDDWFFPYIQTAYEKGIVNGYDDGSFAPENTVNLAEALKMLIKTSGTFNEPYVSPTLFEDPAPDVLKDTWYANYVSYAFANGLAYIKKDGNLHAGDPLTRGALADIIYRFKNPGIYSGVMEYGVASYYGQSFDGHNTASGEPLAQNEYQAAHKTLPFGSHVRVTNPANGNTIIVKIVDRGPYVEGRILDLTTGAFEALGKDLSAGVVEVEMEIVYN
ncbi:MAG: septal ring lytic transglycosylase RlpA family protein [Candidatus Gracilibacteria bacterium]